VETASLRGVPARLRVTAVIVIVGASIGVDRSIARFERPSI
jgi:hypothetical protein